MSDRFLVGVTPDFYVDAKGSFEPVLAEKLGEAGIEYQAMPALPGNVATPEVLNQYDGVFALATRITAESLQGVERLAIIARWGVGYDMIDIPALTAADAVLAITPNAVRTPVAEAIFTLMLALAKNIRTQDRITREGKWRGALPSMGRNLRGQILGSVGLGNIGSEMFRLGRPFGFARLLAYDPYASGETAGELGVELTDLATVFRESDYVAINCPLNEHTRHLIGHAELCLMKTSACLVNTARGPIVDETALVQALQEHRIAGAGLDVFDREPPRPDHPFFSMENVILAPHGLAWTEELARDNGREACDHLLSVSRGELPDGIVNREVVRHPGFIAKLSKYAKASRS